MLIEEEDFKALRESIDNCPNFDNIDLAVRLEKHALLEFRRIAAHLYKLNKRWAQSITLSKKDKLFKDSMNTAAESRDVDIAEELLNFFIEQDRKDCFTAALYICFDLLRPDVIMELSWRYKLQDFAMPYMIQVTREALSRVDVLEKANKSRTEKDVEKEKEEAQIIGASGMGQLMIGYGQQQQQPGMNMQSQGYGGQGYGGMQPNGLH